MVAPVDATASLEADGETFTLAMNFRTIALAEDEKPTVVSGFGAGKATLTGMATLVWAFARPAHPELTLDQALALIMRHGEAVGVALAELFRLASAKPDGGAPADGTANPRKRRGGSMS